ncbi:MAG: sulfatase [Planctomycetia bacterium]|nr:sulfatase [Planctomycetia bacterium]
MSNTRGSHPMWAVIALLSLATYGHAAATAAPTPNVVLIYIDDLGYGDLGCYGAKDYRTPHLDRMAAEGARLTRFYTAQPVCSASRAALLTGCYSNRVGFHGALNPWTRFGIHDGETTLAEVLKSRGYATAIYGKWHLGHQPQFLPTRHGFDEYFGLPYSNDMWPYHPDFLAEKAANPDKEIGYPDLPLWDGERIKIPAVTAKYQRQLTTWYTEHATSFIDRNRERPFFLYVPHSMVHVPLYVSDRYQGKSGVGTFGDVMEEIDWSVGEILAALRRNGLDERTLVLFSSDNGPWLSYGDHAGSSGGLREGKGTVWEGGVRVPLLARWPKQIPAGRVCAEPAMTIDILPTVAKLAGAELPKAKIDGLDIWPLLAGPKDAKSPHEALYFYYRDNELQAVSSGNWKLYFPHTYIALAGRQGGRDGTPSRYELRTIDEPELYQLVDDVAETRNVAAQYPDVVEKLQAYAELARNDLGDSLTDRPGPGRRAPGFVEN